MEPDLTKLQSTTLQPAFKNNNEYSGSFTLTGSISGVSKTFATEIELPTTFSDNADIFFKGRADGGFSVPTGDPRSNDAWFKRGAVWARTNDAGAGYTDYPMAFLLSAKITGNILRIEASTFKTFIANLAITDEPVYYKVIDYSVF